jgi:single-strand DNA-binding protein
MSINRVVISGNLTRDPELRSTQSGMQILSFGMAVNDRRKNNQTGEWEDYPNFVDCVVFGQRAESLSRFLHKGMKVMVDGKLRYSSWEKDGQRRSKLEVIADDVDLPPRGSGQQQPAQPQQQQGYAQPTYGAPAPMPAQQQYQPQPQAPQPQQPAQPQQQQLGGMPRQQPPTMDVYDADIPF